MKAINSYRSSARVTEEIEDTRAIAQQLANATQKWRRGYKIKMPIPRIIGLAIDKAIHELRKLPEDDWAYSLKSDTFTTKTK